MYKCAHVEGEMDFFGGDTDEHPCIILISNFHSAYYLMIGWSTGNHLDVSSAVFQRRKIDLCLPS